MKLNHRLLSCIFSLSQRKLFRLFSAFKRRWPKISLKSAPSFQPWFCWNRKGIDYSTRKNLVFWGFVTCFDLNFERLYKINKTSIMIKAWLILLLYYSMSKYTAYRCRNDKTKLYFKNLNTSYAASVPHFQVLVNVLVSGLIINSDEINLHNSGGRLKC